MYPRNFTVYSSSACLICRLLKTLTFVNVQPPLPKLFHFRLLQYCRFCECHHCCQAENKRKASSNLLQFILLFLCSEKLPNSDSSCNLMMNHCRPQRSSPKYLTVLCLLAPVTFFTAVPCLFHDPTINFGLSLSNHCNSLSVQRYLNHTALFLQPHISASSALSLLMPARTNNLILRFHNHKNHLQTSPPPHSAARTLLITLLALSIALSPVSAIRSLQQTSCPSDASLCFTATGVTGYCCPSQFSCFPSAQFSCYPQGAPFPSDGTGVTDNGFVPGAETPQPTSGPTPAPTTGPPTSTGAPGEFTILKSFRSSDVIVVSVGEDCEMWALGCRCR